MDVALDARVDADQVVYVCALDTEARALRKAGVPVRVLGLSAAGSVPDEPLVALGLAGALVPGVDAGTLLTAERVVDEEGDAIWEGAPWPARGARRAVLCSVGRVVDDPDERAELAERTGAIACDMESGPLAATGRLRGIVRAVADGPERPLGALAHGANADGSVAWSAVLRAFLREPVGSARSARGARRSLAALSRSIEVGARG
jgi:hypothetical protein